MQNEMIIYKSEDNKINVELYEKDGTIWLNQKQIAELFDSSKQNIGQHIKNIFFEKELDENSVVKFFFTTAKDNKTYNIAYYNLEMILAIGFRIKGKRGTEFRIWANTVLKEFLQKGFIVDSERLKNPNGRYDYFDELLEKIRDIRASEKRFYQKVRELFALSNDYDKTDKATQLFFANTQNKMLYAITGKTAAEIIISRANENIPNMGLNSFKGSVVRKTDIYISKNYLTKDEIDDLNRLVIIFLETAEYKAKKREFLTMNFWVENVNKILELNEHKILTDNGTISNKQMEKIVEEKYKIFDKNRKEYEAQLEDKKDLEELEELDNKIKDKNN